MNEHAQQRQKNAAPTMDTYAQRAGTFSPEQELERLRRAWAELLIEPAARQTAARKTE